MADTRACPSIIVADDELAVRAALSSILAEAGYEVRPARDGDEALELYHDRRPDLMLLDVMMPRMGGYAVCSEVRRHDGDTPVVFLTALDREADELHGLGLGADDYISKAQSEAMILARVAAALRRAPMPSAAFRLGSWTVEPDLLSMRSGSGGTEALTEREVAMLRAFAEHPGEVFNRDFLITRFWNGESPGDAALTVAVSRLREKLGADGAMLVTVHRVGYSWQPTGCRRCEQ